MPARNLDTLAWYARDMGDTVNADRLDDMWHATATARKVSRSVVRAAIDAAKPLVASLPDSDPRRMEVCRLAGILTASTDQTVSVA